MSDQSVELVGSTSSKQSRFAPHRVALMTMWFLTTVAFIVMLCHGVRNTDQYRVLRYLLQVAYVTALLWHLGRAGFSLRRLPDPHPAPLQRWKIGRLIPVLCLALMLALTALSDEGFNILLLFMMIATIWILLAWRREISLRSVVIGFATVGIALLGGLLLLKNSFATKSFILLFSAFVPPMFIAGGLLLNHTGLGASQLHAGRYGTVLTSFLWGCLLFIPLALSNAASGSPGARIAWVNEAWMPLVLPLFSGIAEEIWFRFLLIGLCFFLLRPAFRRWPEVAVLAAMAFSAIMFGLGHGRTLDTFLTTGLLYGLPMAAIYATHDWEHTVGAHYMVNMIPWVMAFLETRAA